MSGGKKINLKSSIPAVKAITRPNLQYRIEQRNYVLRNFVALSFLVSGQYFKEYHKILGTLGLGHVSSTQWIHIVEWIAPFVKRIADWSVQEARTEALRRGDKSSLHIQFDGFFLTRGHYSNNSCAIVHDAKTGKIIAYLHRTTNVSCLGNSSMGFATEKKNQKNDAQKSGQRSTFSILIF